MFFEKLKFGKVVFFFLPMSFLPSTKEQYLLVKSKTKETSQSDRKGKLVHKYDLNQVISSIHLHARMLFSLKSTKIYNSPLLFLSESSWSPGNYVRTIQIGFLVKS